MECSPCEHVAPSAEMGEAPIDLDHKPKASAAAKVTASYVGSHWIESRDQIPYKIAPEKRRKAGVNV